LTFASIRERVAICNCTAAAASAGLVFGDEDYARNSGVCRSGVHAGAIGVGGGDVIVHVVPAFGRRAGSEWNKVLSQPASLDGWGYRAMTATPGNLLWARRLAAAYAEQSRPFPGAQQSMIVPAPIPQAAGLDNDTLRGDVRERPNFAQVSPPVIMPPSWRMPVRRPDEALPAAVVAAGASVPTPTQAPRPEAAQPIPTPIVGAAPPRGTVEVLSTAVLAVAGQRVTLAHIEGIEGTPARGLAGFLASRGGTVACEAVGSAGAMRCLTRDGIDVAEAALFNGGARTAPGAPASYIAAEAAARQARRGIWASVPQ
jgi:hypothetical protein